MKLFLKNFPHFTKEEDLKELFENFGHVFSVKIIRNKLTQSSRCFAFMKINFYEDGDKIIKELNGKKYNGRILTVMEAKPKNF